MKTRMQQKVMPKTSDSQTHKTARTGSGKKSRGGGKTVTFIHQQKRRASGKNIGCSFAHMTQQMHLIVLS